MRNLAVLLFLFQVSVAALAQQSGSDGPFLEPKDPGYFVRVQGGEGRTGSPLTETGHSPQENREVVFLSGFEMAKYDVTQGLYQEVMGTDPASLQAGDRNLPIDQVSWYDAVEFCDKLSDRDGLKKVYAINGAEVSADWQADGYRLPTDAEWEYAARGGAASLSAYHVYSGSDEPDSVSWYMKNSMRAYHPVGQKAPNELGLFDMTGNVDQWCWDWPSASGHRYERDPVGNDRGTNKVIRGGDARAAPAGVRVARQSSLLPGKPWPFVGFRLVKSVVQPATPPTALSAVVWEPEENGYFAAVSSGTFLMGSPESEPDRKPDEVSHQVTGSAFLIGKTPVTLGLYSSIMGVVPRKSQGADPRLPVLGVSWFDAVFFCNALSDSDGLQRVYKIQGKSVSVDRQADGYRLPTEAEWEDAARGGPLGSQEYHIFAGSDDPSGLAWYRENSGNQLHPVGGKKPNELGISDLNGNVVQWCWDWYGPYSLDQTTDPMGPATGTLKVTRGGGPLLSGSGAVFEPWNIRTAYRVYDLPPDEGNMPTGFRIARNGTGPVLPGAAVLDPRSASAARGTVETLAGQAGPLVGPVGLALDARGVLYVFDGSRVLKLLEDGTLRTIAGSGVAGHADGQAELATFESEGSLTVDTQGNIYVAESRREENNRIRKVTPAGLVSTIAGSGEPGHEDGQGLKATFHAPSSVAVDAAGNLYVADTFGERIRLISPRGVVSTLAGSGKQGRQNGAGSSASFSMPTGVALDKKGNLYVVDSANNQVRLITPEGKVTTWAGSGVFGSSDGPAQTASFAQPGAATVDAAGNVFVSENGAIRKITPEGTVVTVARIPGLSPGDIAVDALGNLYIADFSALAIDKISADGTVTTLLRDDLSGKQNGNRDSARFQRPFGITADRKENLFVLDFDDQRIRKVNPAGQVSTFAGSGLSGKNDGAGILASFDKPGGLAIDPADNLLVSDFGNDLIRKITPDGTVTVFAGSGLEGQADGTLMTAEFDRPGAMAVDSHGNLYVLTYGNFKPNTVAYYFIREITVEGAVKTLGRVDKEIPTALAVDTRGTVFFVSDDLWKLDAKGQAVLVKKDALADARPNGLAIDPSGNLLVSTENNQILSITPSGDVSPWAGSGAVGSSDGPLLSASFNDPGALAVDSGGRVFVADKGNDEIRLIP